MYAIANSIALNGLDADTVIQSDVRSYWEYILMGGGATLGALAVLFVILGQEKARKQDERMQGGKEDA
jgi:hypothetical protein